MVYSCYFCESEYVGVITAQKWCENCRKIKNLGNVYGFKEVYNILERCCIRKEQQITNKINIELKKEIQTRSKTEKKEINKSV